MKITTSLWTHQQYMRDEVAARLNQFGAAFLIADCRTGKTLASAAAATVESISAQKIIVITIIGAMNGAWPSDIGQYTEGANLLLLNKGTSAQKALAMRSFLTQNTGTRIVVVNYETAVLITDDIKAAGFDMVIADESQKLKSHDSQQSTLLAMACADIPYKVIMTGTPWDDRISDVYGQMRFLTPEPKGKKTCHSRLLGTWGSFLYQFCETYELSQGVKIIKGYKNVERLADILRPYIIRVRAKDVLDLPPTRTIVKKVPMFGETKRIYRELQEEMIAQFGDDYLVGDNKLVCELRLHQATGGFVQPYRIDEVGRYIPSASVETPIPDKSANAKLDALLELDEEFGPEPYVVFTRFKADVRKVKAALEKAGRKVKVLTGDLKENEEWQAGAGDVLIANIQAGNAGIRLTRARLVVDYTIGNSRTDFIQSRSRFLANGLDKDLPITYHFLEMENSVDGEILRRMQKKEGEADMLMDKVLNAGVDTAL